MAIVDSNIMDNVVIILVDPSHPGNIGSAARAMKTMGLKELRIVKKENIINSDSIALAKGARDVLESAKIYNTLDDALKDITLVAGTSARSRSIELPLYQPHEAVKKIAEHVRNDNKCAIIFGRERTGLTNEELQRCDIHVNIDANPDYSSLNLAMSVQVISYELRQILITDKKEKPPVNNEFIRKPTHDEVEAYYDFIEKNLLECGFLKEGHNGKVMGQIRRIYAKADLTYHELRILYGILATMLKYEKNANSIKS
ncbi:MAG: RNA methyltransferase [Succinivibrionaceae bacterium]